MNQYKWIKFLENNYWEKRGTKGRVPFHSSYLPSHKVRNFDTIKLIWGDPKDFSLINFLIQNGKELSNYKFLRSVVPFASLYAGHPDDLEIRCHRFNDIYWCTHNDTLSIFGLEKDIFNLAIGLNMDPLPRYLLSSHYTLEYYGFEPSGGWDEFEVESSLKYCARKFHISGYYYHWAINGYKEMNPNGKGYVYPQEWISHPKPRGKKLSLDIQ